MRSFSSFATASASVTATTVPRRFRRLQGRREVVSVDHVAVADEHGRSIVFSSSRTLPGQ
jgi:hypothetical protein